MAVLQALQPDVLLHTGDITYVDRYNDPSAWDVFFQMAGPSGRGLFPSIPALFLVGNHEIESPACQRRSTLGAWPSFQAFNARLPSPRASPGGQDVIDTTAATNTDSKSAAANQYFSVDLPGVHMVFVSSYIYNDTFATDSLQYTWLENDLRAVNRTVTPWLIVNFHEPWYSSYANHFKENECMRQAYEPLLTKYGVDITFSGHVHAYERTLPVSNYTLSDRGAVHFSVGNGGTMEPLSSHYIEAQCPLFGSLVQPQYHDWLPASCMVSVQYTANGTDCPSLNITSNVTSVTCLGGRVTNVTTCSQGYTSQPAWSSYREAAFGAGLLTIINTTTAYWEYFRLSDNMPDLTVPQLVPDSMRVADWAFITKSS